MKHIYIKQYSNLSYATTSSSTYSAKTLAKQKIRRDRKISSLISYDNKPDDALTNPNRLFRIGARHHHLMHPSQLLKKPIQHVKFNHVRYKSTDNFPLPSYWNKSRVPPLIKESDLEIIDLDSPDLVAPVTKIYKTIRLRSAPAPIPERNPLSDIISLINIGPINTITNARYSHDTFYQFRDLERIELYTNFQDEFHSIQSGTPINTLSSMITDERRLLLADMTTRVLSYKARRKAFNKKNKFLKEEIIPSKYSRDNPIFLAGSYKRSLDLDPITLNSLKRIRTF
ncbi:hypothetical protein C1645_781663 [Glomus cerebriforme]|uniref:DUF8211 domain-containing protein n=1 Tax=Glomus cerebriforme TaxID=658196 RepID=A0A397SLQ6_9GLOM|nr:hypothetical protein C1645_781663 [Glomus cerebriforme]